MASIIRVKRSTGTSAPSTLNYGELAYTIGGGTQANRGQRFFIGDSSSNPQLIGGQYYTDLLSNTPGSVAAAANATTAANGFVAIVDQNRKVDQWNVDNLTLDGNALTSTDTDGHITITPNGTGRVQFLDDDELQFGTSDDIRLSYDTAKDAIFFERGDAGATADIRVADDIHFQFGTDNDARIYYDEASTDRIQVEGASWSFDSTVGQVRIETTTHSSDSTTGALVVDGGVGIAGTVNIASDLAVEGGDVTSSNSTLNLFDANVTHINAFGAGTNIDIGAATGIATIHNATVDLDGDLNIDGGDVTSNNTSLNLFDSTVTHANVLGAGEFIDVGANAGITTINNLTLDVPNATTVTIGDQNTATSVTFESTPNTSFVSIAATTNATSTTTGALRVAGGVGIASDVYIGGDLDVAGASTFTGDVTYSGNVTVQQDLTVNGNTNLGNADTDNITIVGSITHTGSITATGGATFDGVGISSNIISTTSGGGNVLYIDPYPDGLSNEGTVIIKGDLQVDGTTTTVNSSSVTVNEPILNLGDVTSVRTVMAVVGSGTTEITLDSVVGINTGDVIDNAGVAGLPALAADRTILYYNSGTKIVSIAANTTAQIGISTQLTITHAFDTNTDRGVSFNYNTSSGTSNNKTGFFGFDDNSIATSGVFESHADDSRRWTFVPDASVSNSVVSGTKGFLDIKGIYYQSGDFSTHGIVYFDSTGLQRSTSAPSSATFTSTQIMTAVTEVVLTLDSTHSFTAGQQITQANNAAAYGMVKTTTSSSNSVTLIGVQGTFDTTNDLLKEGSNISIVPTVVSTTYSDRPVWTTTIDGGTF